jgi:N-acetylneuraminic acid mutarotase
MVQKENAMKNAKGLASTIFAMVLGLVVIGASNQAFAQSGTWETKAPMPTARWYTTGGVMNGKLYVVGGSGTNSTNPTIPVDRLEVYDPATNTWATKAPMPAARLGAGAAVINGKLYVVGGEQNPQKFATLQVYDPATDTWATKASMPTPRSGPGVVAIDGQLYVAGGCLGGCAPATGVLEVYDPATDTWTTKAPLPTARGGAGVAVVNGLFYVMGGGWGWDSADSELKHRTIEVYNPTTNTWTTKAQHVVGVFGTAGSINGKIYSAGFAALTPVLTNAEVYDPATDTWASLSPMPTGRYLVAGGVINGKLYVAGGTDASYTPFATLEAFTPGETCQQQVQDLQNQVTTLASQNTQLQNQLTVANTQIVQLQGQVTTLTLQNQTLTQQNSQLQNQLTVANTQIVQLQGQVTTLTLQNQTLTQQNSQLQTQVNAVNSGLSNIQQALGQAFSNPQFTVPGATPLERYQNLVNAILSLNRGRLQGVYMNLGGK